VTTQAESSNPVSTGSGAEQASLFVPYTNDLLTRTALQAAATLAKGLSARITLIVVSLVPFPCELDCPQVAPGHLRRRMGMLIAASSVDANITVVYAREQMTGLRHAIGDGSLVLLAAKRRPWRTAEERLARKLREAGHTVVLLFA
jgi:hypothetical protein